MGLAEWPGRGENRGRRGLHPLADGTSWPGVPTADAYADCDGNSDGNSDINIYANTNANTHTFFNPNASDANANGSAHSYADERANPTYSLLAYRHARRQ